MATIKTSAFEILEGVVDVSSIKISEKNILKGIKFDVEVLEENIEEV